MATEYVTIQRIPHGSNVVFTKPSSYANTSTAITGFGCDPYQYTSTSGTTWSSGSNKTRFYFSGSSNFYYDARHTFHFSQSPVCTLSKTCPGITISGDDGVYSASGKQITITYRGYNGTSAGSGTTPYVQWLLKTTPDITNNCTKIKFQMYYYPNGNNLSTCGSCIIVRPTAYNSTSGQFGYTSSYISNSSKYDYVATHVWYNSDDAGTSGTYCTSISGEETISHNTDGTKTIYVGIIADLGSGGSYASLTTMLPIVLPTIPRASSVIVGTSSSATSSITSSTFGTNLYFNYKSIVKGFTHKLTVTDENGKTLCSGTHDATAASTLYNISVKNASTSTTSTYYAMPLNWLTTNDTAGTKTSTKITATLITYNGTTKIGTSSASVTIKNTSAQCAPTLTATDPTVPTYSIATGTIASTSANSISAYSTGDTITIPLSYSYLYNAKIKSVTATLTSNIANNTITLTSQADSISIPVNSTAAAMASAIDHSQCTGTITIKLTDTRGYTSTVEKTVTLIRHLYPGIRTVVCQRAESAGSSTEAQSGTYLYFSVTAVRAAVQYGPLTLKVYYKTGASSTWTLLNYTSSSESYTMASAGSGNLVNTTASTSSGWVLSTLATGSIYNIKFEVSDSVGSATYTSTIGKSFTFISFVGEQVGIGTTPKTNYQAAISSSTDNTKALILESSDTQLNVTSSVSPYKSMGIGIGGGGNNRGIYDNTNDHWAFSIRDNDTTEYEIIKNKSGGSMYFDGSNFYPSTNQAVSLGLSNYEWNSAYIKTLSVSSTSTFSGKVTVNNTVAANNYNFNWYDEDNGYHSVWNVYDTSTGIYNYFCYGYIRSGATTIDLIIPDRFTTGTIISNLYVGLVASGYAVSPYNVSSSDYYTTAAGIKLYKLIENKSNTWSTITTTFSQRKDGVYLVITSSSNAFTRAGTTTTITNPTPVTGLVRIQYSS